MIAKNQYANLSFRGNRGRYNGHGIKFGLMSGWNLSIRFKICADNLKYQTKFDLIYGQNCSIYFKICVDN